MSVSNKNILRLLTVGALAIFATGAYAQTDETAADVDARFASLEARVQSVMRANFNLMRTSSQQQQQIEQQQQQITQQQQQIAQLQASTVDGLNEFVSVDVDQHGRPAVFFDAVNLYVRNGSGSTYTTSAEADSGLGNIILGYNETASSSVDHFCTRSWSPTTHKVLPTWEDCHEAGFEWTNNNKTGTHNLIIGKGHNYTGEGNIMLGLENSASDTSGIVGGWYNHVGMNSVVLGSEGSKGFNWASILASRDSLAYHGSIISSSLSSITKGYGSIINSYGVDMDDYLPDIYINGAPYTAE